MRPWATQSLIPGLLISLMTVLLSACVYWFSGSVSLPLCLAIVSVISFYGGLAFLRIQGNRQASVLRSAITGESTSLGNAYRLDRSFKDVALELSTLLGKKESLQQKLRDGKILKRVHDAQRSQVEEILTVLLDGVILCDPFGDLLLGNPAAGCLLEFDPVASVRQPLSGLITPVEITQAVTELCRNHTPGEHRQLELTIPLDDATTEDDALYLDITLSSLGNAQGEFTGLVIILRDLSRERQLSQMKSEFVAKASHELRTPLSSIRAYVEMLVDGEAADADSRREFYEIIQSETDRLGRLIDNMLNISRIEAGIVQIDRTLVDMKSLVERAAKTLEPRASKKNMTISRRCATVDCSVDGDEDMLFQVVLNLVSNAVKYTPDEGRVTIAVDIDNLTRSVLVSVSDTGFGIPPADTERIFEKFYRVDNYKRFAEGTGLGLNVCKHIVETVHGGQINVESEYGMGSRFWFSIPMELVELQDAA